MKTENAGWPATTERVAASLAEAGLSPATIRDILRSACPALMFAAEPADEARIPIGATKIGGRPDLPPGMAWPERPPYDDGGALAKEALDGAARFHADAGIVPPWMDAEQGAALLEANARQKADTLAFMKTLDVEGVDLDSAFFGFTAEDCAVVAREALAKSAAATTQFPLAFLGQFDLAALAREEGFDPALPRSGRLYLFYDLFLLPPSYAPSSRIGLHVVHDDTTTEALVRTDIPAALAALTDLNAMMTPARVTPTPAVTIAAPYGSGAQPSALSDDDQSAVQDWLSNIAGWPGDGAAGAHQLGGWPREIQSSMAGTAALAANGVDAGMSDAWKSPEAQRLLEGATEWRLLFQLGPDEPIGNGLPGALNILIRAEDMAARRFDRAWAVYEQS
jgi:hypothetical protein